MRFLISEVTLYPQDHLVDPTVLFTASPMDYPLPGNSTNPFVLCSVGVKGYRGTSLIRKPPSLDPTVGLYLGSYGGPRGKAVSHERGIPGHAIKMPIFARPTDAESGLFQSANLSVGRVVL